MNWGYYQFPSLVRHATGVSRTCRGWNRAWTLLWVWQREIFDNLLGSSPHQQCPGKLNCWQRWLLNLQTCVVFLEFKFCIFNLGLRYLFPLPVSDGIFCQSPSPLKETTQRAIATFYMHILTKRCHFWQNILSIYFIYVQGYAQQQHL